MRSLSVSGAAITGPVKPADGAASISCGSASTAGVRRGRPSAATAAASRPSWPAHRLARDGAHHELRRVGADRQRDRRGLAAQHVERLADDRAQDLFEIDDRAHGAADLVHGDQLAHARRQPLLVLLEAAGHDPEGLGHIADLVALSTVMLVSRSPRAIDSAPACRSCSGRVIRRGEQVGEPIASSSATSAPEHQRRAGARRRAAASGSRSTATPEQADRGALTSCSWPKATEYACPSTSSARPTSASASARHLAPRAAAGADQARAGRRHEGRGVRARGRGRRSPRARRRAPP